MPARTSKDGSVALVQTRLTPLSGRAAHADFRLRETDEGWKLFDVALDGTSLLATYRISFDQELRKSGLDGLIRNLAARNAANRKVL